MASLSSLNGIGSGVDTSALVSAIINQKSGSLTRLQTRKATNDKHVAALAAMKTSLTALNLSMAILHDKFKNQTVTSTDSTNTYVAATASQAQTGNYEISVKTVATKGRVSASLDLKGLTTNMAVENPITTKIVAEGSVATFAVQGTDGVIKTITVDSASNTLNSLRDKINASGAGVSASVVNMGRGGNPYQLVITAKATGTGDTEGVVSFADVTPGGATNLIGVESGDLDSENNAIVGGLKSLVAATDATFSLDGIELTRSTNVISDVIDGVTINLKQGGQAGATTLTVATDKVGTAVALQDFITKYNAFVKDYKTASTSTKNSDGSINQAALSSDPATHNLMSTIRTVLTGSVLTGEAFKTLASVGVTSMAEGGFYMNNTQFQTAMGVDSEAINQLLFSDEGLATKVQAAISTFTVTTTTEALKSIAIQNKNLDIQIQTAHYRLERERETLTLKFAKADAAVGAMKAVLGSFTGL